MLDTPRHKGQIARNAENLKGGEGEARSNGSNSLQVQVSRRKGRNFFRSRGGTTSSKRGGGGGRPGEVDGSRPRRVGSREKYTEREPAGRPDEGPGGLR